MNLKQLIGAVARLVVGGVLVYAGASKALAPAAEFAASLAAYRLFSLDLCMTIARLWPWVELLVGTYVLFGYYTRLAAAAAAALFAAFLVILSATLIRGIDPGSCGCFGMGLNFSLRQTLMLDATVFLLALMLTYIARVPLVFSTDKWIDR